MYCVNDGAVMRAWGLDQGIGGSILTFLADPNSELTQALGMEITHAGPVSVLGPGRAKRFAIYADDGVIKSLQVSEAPDDPAGDSDPSASCVENMLKQI